MDWADDAAYCLNDLVDSINAGFLRLEGVQEWAERKLLQPIQAQLAEFVLEAIRERKADSQFSKKIGVFIRSCSLIERDVPLANETNRYRLGIYIDPEVRREADFYKMLSQDLVFDHSQLHQLRRKARVILENLFRAFAESYLDGTGLRLLPESFDRIIRTETDQSAKARILCDYLAGMTDVFATRTYKRLFDPDFGSIFDPQ
jgi:dGTPase